uniref:Uncharacterized protein n=3 Tax=Brassica TaxID=3705 RepID=A0A0D3E8L0_BRAOL|nr:unnamed protein product [Brassica oleracea]
MLEAMGWILKVQQKDKPSVLNQPAGGSLPMIDEVIKQLVEKTKSTPGAKLENNKFCLSVHFHCVDEKVPHLRGLFPWVRLGSGPLHPGGLYLGWGQGPTPSTAFGDRIGSSPPSGVEPVNMTIGP